MDLKKRSTLTFAVGALAGAGVVAVSVPFVKSLQPAAHKEPPQIDIDIGKLKEGQNFTVAWLAKPLYVLKRSPDILLQLQDGYPDLLDPNSAFSHQPLGAKNYHRSLRPDIFVAWGICNHLGCSVSHNPPGQNAEYGEPFK